MIKLNVHAVQTEYTQSLLFDRHNVRQGSYVARQKVVCNVNCSRDKLLHIFVILNLCFTIYLNASSSSTRSTPQTDIIQMFHKLNARTLVLDILQCVFKSVPYLKLNFD